MKQRPKKKKRKEEGSNEENKNNPANIGQGRIHCLQKTLNGAKWVFLDWLKDKHYNENATWNLYELNKIITEVF